MSNTLRKFIRIRDRNQITLPAEIISGMAVQPGDFLEIGRTEDGSVYLKPTIVVAVDSPEARREESLAEQDIASGAYKTFNSAEEFMQDLRSKRAATSKKQKKGATVEQPEEAASVG